MYIYIYIYMHIYSGSPHLSPSAGRPRSPEPSLVVKEFSSSTY